MDPLATLNILSPLIPAPKLKGNEGKTWDHPPLRVKKDKERYPKSAYLVQLFWQFELAKNNKTYSGPEPIMINKRYKLQYQERDADVVVMREKEIETRLPTIKQGGVGIIRLNKIDPVLISLLCVSFTKAYCYSPITDNHHSLFFIGLEWKNNPESTSLIIELTSGKLKIFSIIPTPLYDWLSEVRKIYIDQITSQTEMHDFRNRKILDLPIPEGGIGMETRVGY
jgi:hypothetical protein